MARARQLQLSVLAEFTIGLVGGLWALGIGHRWGVIWGLGGGCILIPALRLGVYHMDHRCGWRVCGSCCRSDY